MAIINLRDFYPWYIQDEFVELSDEIAAELVADKRYQKAYERRTFYHKAHYSLDVDNGIETVAINQPPDNPEVIFEMMERHCRLCCALNSLPEIQGRRIEAHYILGQTQKEIAEAEGVTKGSVSISITRGLEAMKIFLQNYDFQSNLCPKFLTVNER